MITLIDSIDSEFNCMVDLVNDNYKCELLLNGVSYRQLEYNLVNTILSNNIGSCTIKIENELGMLRSQILFVKIDKFGSHDNDYYTSESNINTI